MDAKRAPQYPDVVALLPSVLVRAAGPGRDGSRAVRTLLRAARLARHAAGALWSQKLKSLLMFLGTAVGIMLLTAVVGLSQGVQERIRQALDFFGPKAIMLWSGGGQQRGAGGRSASSSGLKAEDLAALKVRFSDRAVLSALVRVDALAVKRGSADTRSRIAGVDEVWPEAQDWYVDRGDPIDEEDVLALGRVAVLGVTTVRNLFGDEDPLGEFITINTVRFRVKGVLASRGTNAMGFDMDDQILVPVSTAMRRLENQDHYDMVRLKVRDPRDLQVVADELTEVMRARHHIVPPEPDDFRVRTPDFLVQRIREMTRTTQYVGAALAVIALVVGGVVLMNILLLSVSERTPEIGLKRALGARERDVFTEFLAESVLVSLVGMVLGVALGLVPILLLPRLFPMIPMALSWKTFLYASLFSTLVGLVFGVQPARRAARLKPVEALR